MTALAAPYDAHEKEGELVAYPIAANTTIWKGALVGLIGLVPGAIQLRMIGVVGYVIVYPVAVGLVAAGAGLLAASTSQRSSASSQGSASAR